MTYALSALKSEIRAIVLAGTHELRRYSIATAALIIGILIYPINGLAQEADDLGKCILASSVLPLLGEPNDTPLIRSTIEGHDAAFFVSPELSKILVRDVSDDFWFLQGQPVRLIAQDHQMVSAEQIEVEQLRMGQVEIGPFPAFVINPSFSKTIGALPIVGLIGRTILFHGIILMIDIPHQSLAFFRWDYKHCGSASTLLGKDAYVAPLSSENSTSGTVAGKNFEIHFDPDLSFNSFPREDIGRISLTDAQVDALPKINLRLTKIHVGHLSEMEPVTLQSHSIGAQQFLIQEQVSRVVLGNPFFRTRTVLFDFSHRQIAYLDVSSTESSPSGPGHYHFDMTYVPRVSVVE